MTQRVIHPLWLLRFGIGLPRMDATVLGATRMALAA